MSDNLVDYNILMNSALQGIIKKVLQDVEQNGLPGNHHFYITFYTNYDGVKMPEELRDQYPEEMLIIIQNWFENLTVKEDYFSIILNFNNTPQALTIPWNAISNFLDPSVEFNIKFNFPEAELKELIVESPMIDINENDTTTQALNNPDKIVSLDTFRKKK